MAEKIAERLQSGWANKEIAQKYAQAENATIPYAEIMVKKSGLVDRKEEANVFDLACGTGALELALYDALPKEKWGNVKVLAGDVSEVMLEFLKERGKKANWGGLETRVVDGKDIQLPSSTYTHIFVNFGIFMLPPTTLQRLHSILKPGGFIAVSSWAYFPWYAQVARAIARVPNPPPLPTEKEIAEKIYQGRKWSSSSFVAQYLKEHGFIDVDVVSEKRRVSCGTARAFRDAMCMPLNMVGANWEERERERLIKEVGEKLYEIAVEDAGGENETIWMEFEGIVGTGRKAA